MHYKQKSPQSAEETKKRDRSGDDNQDEDVDMPDLSETPFRKRAQPSSRKLSRTRSASKDEDVDMDRRQRESAPAPEANENVAMNRQARRLAPAPAARDSMSPASHTKQSPARSQLERRASLVPGFSLPPGTQLFTTPSLFTGTHAVKNSVGGIDLPIRDASSRPGDAKFANGNVKGSGDVQSRAPPTPSPPPQHTNLPATRQQPTILRQEWLLFAKEMLLTKSDALAWGFDWSLPEFKRQFDFLHGVPGTSGYMFSTDQKHLMAGMSQRIKAGLHRPESLPRTLGHHLTAVIAELPSSAAPPSVNHENQPDPPDDSDSQDDSDEADLKLALEMSLEVEKDQPYPTIESDSQDDSDEADLRLALAMSLEGGINQPHPSTKLDSQQNVLALGISPPPESPSSQLSHQEPARPPTPPLGPHFTPINGCRRRKLSGGSDADQSVSSIESAGPQHSIGTTLVNRPTRSFGRREERSGGRAEERTDSAVENTQRLTIHPTYECCCPHCGFFGESYTKFKRHLEDHFSKEGWTEYRCPVKGCDQVFAKWELTKYMKYLEEQGLIQPKDRGVRDSQKHEYQQWKHHAKWCQMMDREKKMRERENSKDRKMKCRIEEVEGSVIELTDDEDEDEG
ncbi:Sphingolipid long chain base-responsive protein [Venturia nashicola]|nr:Sphingolipid long chain base-responsive protein [Venturia nashicola]